MDTKFIDKCKKLLAAYKSGKLGQTRMPEDSNPGFSSGEQDLKLAYFTLPMALNYQRDSYKLWEAALKTYSDPETKFVFEVGKVTLASEDEVRKALMRYKLALQPNKHINTWRTISKTLHEKWGTFGKFIDSSQGDFLQLKKIINEDNKKGFPYLSGPKIFNYWSFIITTYGGVNLINRDHIEIAPDTHITQCSVKLGIITDAEVGILTKDAISEKWRKVLKGSNINPMDMHPPLWFWSRNGFIFDI